MDIKKLRKLRKMLVTLRTDPANSERLSSGAEFAAEISLRLIDAIAPEMAIDVPPVAGEHVSARIAPDRQAPNPTLSGTPFAPEGAPRLPKS